LVGDHAVAHYALAVVVLAAQLHRKGGCTDC
jgi:hypothetical protein